MVQWNIFLIERANLISSTNFQQLSATYHPLHKLSEWMLLFDVVKTKVEIEGLSNENSLNETSQIMGPVCRGAVASNWNDRQRTIKEKENSKEKAIWTHEISPRIDKSMTESCGTRHCSIWDNYCAHNRYLYEFNLNTMARPSFRSMWDASPLVCKREINHTFR